MKQIEQHDRKTRRFNWAMLVVAIMAAPVQAEPVPVTASAATPYEHQWSREFTGTFTAKLQTELSSAQAGLVQQVNVDAGQTVSAGALLASLDQQLAEQKVAEQQAAVAFAAASMQEQQRLVDEADKVVAEASLPATELRRRQAEMQQAKAEWQRQQALLQQAKLALRQHQITAPFAAVVTARQAMPGMWIQPGQTVLSLVSLEALWLDVDIPQQYYRQISQLTQAQVTADIAPETPLQLPIVAKIPVSNDGSRAFQLRLSYQNPAESPLILPGTSAHVSFQMAKETFAAIPNQALLRHPDGAHSVFVLQFNAAVGATGQVTRQLVNVITQQDQQVVVSGLAPDAWVVTAGHQQFSTSATVVLQQLQSVQGE